MKNSDIYKEYVSEGAGEGSDYPIENTIKIFTFTGEVWGRLVIAKAG